LYGEEGEEHLKDSRSFVSKSPWKRAVITLGGVAMNFLVASIIFYFLLGTNGFQTQLPLIFDYKFPLGSQKNFSVISGIAKKSPAEKAGLKARDYVIKANGEEFGNTGKLIEFINQNKGKEITLSVKEPTGQMRDIKVIPRVNPPKGQGAIGIALMDISEVSYNGFLEKASSGFLHSLNLSHYSFVDLGHYLNISLAEKNVKPLASSLSGPVGILALTKITVQEGFSQVILLVAIISLALAMVNILPIPPLDGGRLMFIGLEVALRRRISPKVERITQEAGMVFFIILFILITYKDLIQFKSILF